MGLNLVSEVYSEYDSYVSLCDLCGEKPMAEEDWRELKEQQSDAKVLERVAERLSTTPTQVLVTLTTPAGALEYPHYFREVPLGLTHVDVYWVLDAWEVNSSPVAHAIKKLLCAGKRGAKDRVKDLQEAGKSVKRAIELEEMK